MSELFSRYCLNFFSSSCITFYLSLLISFLFLQLFRIKNPRLSYYCYLLPFFKILWDLGNFTHTSWIFYHGETILSQAPNTRLLTVSLEPHWLPFCEVKLHLKGHLLFSCGDVLFEMIGPLWSSLLVIGFVTLTSYFVGRKVISLILYSKEVYSVDSISSICIAGIRKPKIIFPKNLLKILSQDEFEAILAHELCHIRWYDNLLNPVLGILEALFWFVPFRKRLLAYAHQFREISCDLSHHNPYAMALALQKSIQFQSMEAHPHLLMFSGKKSIAIKRIHTLLNKLPNKANLWKQIGFILFFLGLLFFLTLSHFLPF